MRKLRTNKACCGECATGKPCASGTPIRTHADFIPDDVRRETHRGSDTLVVPLVMAKTDVIMNDVMLPLSECDPIAWNGTPVTIGHPELQGEFISASETPAIHAAWTIGTVFNTSVDGNKLKAEAWLNVADMERLSPGLLERLERGDPTDVSTGLFSEKIKKPGTLNGVSYNAIHADVTPDHLAILPFEAGACSWEDGCGVRVNSRTQAHVTVINKLMETMAMKLRLNKAKAPKTNARSDDDNLSQMVADLVSNTDSPFTAEDEDSLRFMTEDTLKSMRDQFAPVASEEEEVPAANEEDEVPAANEGEEEIPAANEGEEDKPVANEEDDKAPMANKQLLTNADREALDFARRAYSDHRSELVATVTANSAITARQAEAMDTATLETVANGLVIPTATYAGRVSANANQGDADTEANEMFASNGVVAHIRAAR